MTAYIMSTAMSIAIIILIISIIGYLKIRKHLRLEVYKSSVLYTIISDIYLILIAFFLLFYILFLYYWMKHPSYSQIIYVSFCLLFFGSIFVGLSILVLGQSLKAVFGVKLKEVDSMTGLMTKNSFEMKVQRILENGNGHYMLSVIDMDNFKMINDCYGHVKGDEAIHVLTDIIKKTVRANDMVGRFGGDEFLILFDGIRENQVDSIMRRIEQAVLSEQKKRGCKVECGISYGATEIEGGSKETYQMVFELADHKLYQMKKEKHSNKK